MSENSKIQWTTHTFNPWIGCTKVSAGCANCYAETLNHRMGWTEWGKGQPRKRTSEANWRKPLQWDKRQAGERQRVFCASLSDWLDDEVDPAWLRDLLNLVRQTPNLDWLLLTKRPENWLTRLNAAYAVAQEEVAAYINLWRHNLIPSNVWVGTSVENQQAADERLPHLLQIPASRKFLSCEPLLGPVQFDSSLYSIDWVIVGGESGPGARRFDINWARQLRDQCRDAGAAFFMKQMGRHAGEFHDSRGDAEAQRFLRYHFGPKGDDPSLWPSDLQIREFPGGKAQGNEAQGTGVPSPAASCLAPTS